MKKTISIFLSLLLLMSSMGLTVSTHFCGGHAMESALNIGKEHLDCGMMDMKQACSNHSDGKTTISKTACCSNEYSYYSIEDDFNAKINLIGVDNDFLFAFVYTYLFKSLTEGENSKRHICYDSPPLLQDIPVLNQSFLI